jgi:hypothetical protein
MNTLARTAKLLLCALALCAGTAQAHLMVAQKGTVNVKQGRAYLMVSLPVSAFTGFDDDGDGQLSTAELQRHAPQLHRQFEAGAGLRVDGRLAPFELLVLNLSAPDERPAGPASQLLVMGHYELGGAYPGPGRPGLRYAMRLHGTGPAEDRIDLAFTSEDRSQVLAFTPQRPERALFTSGLELLTEQLRSGAEHVWGGADHLLFLLVVLAEAVAARRSWRHGLALLTVFTLGHGLTLAGTTLGGFAPSPSIVEPAIAVSIVVMAIHAWRQLHRTVPVPARVHLLLVLACALVHGLGLADALRGQGWSRGDLPWALAGFNIGVELAQLAVALVGVAALVVVQRLVAPGAPGGSGLARGALPATEPAARGALQAQVCAEAAGRGHDAGHAGSHRTPTSPCADWPIR